MASVTRGIAQASVRLQESLDENDQLRRAIQTSLSESETKMLIAELGGKTSTIKEDFTQSDPNEKLSLPNMMLKLKHLKDHAEATNRENRAIRDVLLACMSEGELRAAMEGDNSSRQSTPSKSDVLDSKRDNSSRQSTPSESDVLDSKEQKVLDVFKERKEQKVRELKEELKEKELKEKELKEKEQTMKEKLGESLKAQSQDSDRSSLSLRLQMKKQIDDIQGKASEKKSLQTHQEWLKERERKWLLEKEENAASPKRYDTLSSYQSNAQRDREKFKSQRDHDEMQIVLAEDIVGKHKQNTKELQLAMADNEKKLVEVTQVFEHEMMVKDELISSIRKSKSELEDRIAAGSTGSIKLERKLAEKEEELQLSNARVKEVELRIKRDTIAMEGLAEKLLEIRKERDASQSREGKQKEMIKVMEELQEELMTSMDPTIKNLGNYKELAGRHEAELEKKNKEIQRLTYLTQSSTFTYAEKNEFITRTKELEEMVKEQAIKLVEYKKVISEEIDTTQIMFKKESEIESLQKEVKMLEEKLEKSESSTNKESAGGEDGFGSYKGMMQSLLGDLKGINSNPLTSKEATEAVELMSVALEKAQEDAKEAWAVAESLTAELEDERTTRKQLAATLMEFMSTMAEDE